jgi:hypothetical protein
LSADDVGAEEGKDMNRTVVFTDAKGDMMIAEATLFAREMRPSVTVDNPRGQGPNTYVVALSPSEALKLYKDLRGYLRELSVPGL